MYQIENISTIVDLTSKQHFLDYKIRTIVIAPDQNYLKYASVLLLSLLEHKCDNEILDILIFCEAVSEKCKDKILKMQTDEMKIRFVLMNKILSDLFPNVQLTSRDYWSTSTFYRLLIPIIMKNYDKVMYIDSDVVVASSYSSIFDCDFGGKSLIAVQDTAAPNFTKQRANRFNEAFKIQSFDFESYFNAGITYFNIKNINTDNYVKVLSTLLGSVFDFQDQDILNYMFMDDVKLVHQRYNFQVGMLNWHAWLDEIRLYKSYAAEWNEAFQSPVFIHYIGKEKPWNSDCWYSEYFWRYVHYSPFAYQILQNLNSPNDGYISVDDVYLILSRRKVIFKYHLYRFLSIFSSKYKKKMSLYDNRLRRLKEVHAYK